MIKHIVMWKLKTTAEGANKDQNAARMKQELEALKNKIAVIRRIEVGINIAASDAAYDVALYSEFSDAKDLDAYQKHPAHVKVADFVNKVRESRVVVDYTID